MSYVKNLIETSDEHTDAATLQCPYAFKLNIRVDQNAVLYSYATPSQNQPWGGVFGPERILTPGSEYHFFRNAAQVRFRSAVAGKPGIVTVEALTPED